MVIASVIGGVLAISVVVATFDGLDLGVIVAVLSALVWEVRQLHLSLDRLARRLSRVLPLRSEEREEDDRRPHGPMMPA